jgi:hypothetical protein
MTTGFRSSAVRENFIIVMGTAGEKVIGRLVLTDLGTVLTRA